jgi:phosphoserine phosphatase
MPPINPIGDIDEQSSSEVVFQEGGTGRVLDLPVLDSNAIIERLSVRHDQRDALLAFDGDGTLWSGDISDDVFLHACRDGWLLEAARLALSSLAARSGLDPSGSASQLGMALFESHKRGLVAEVELYAAMAWCYAGHTLQELIAYAEYILQIEKFTSRIRLELSHILDWARQRKIGCYVVSASPTPIVCLAATQLGFSPDHVIGTEPRICGGVIVPEITDGVPYCANKCNLLRRRSEHLAWLACFGDSEFDFEMLECAELAVAVSPKFGLLAKLLPLRHAVLLKTGP